MITQVTKNLEKLHARVAAAARRSGRDEGSAKLVAVTKGRSQSDILALQQAGALTFGENRVQEAREKFQALHPERSPGAQGEPGREPAEDCSRPLHVQLHLIGHLQSNKARQACGLFDLIQSLDRPELARKLAAILEEEARSRRLPVLVQVNASFEASKAGCSPHVLEELLATVAALPSLELRGLMTIAAGGKLAGDRDAARRSFILLRELSERHAGIFSDPSRVELSMGMSQDFEVAVEEGATMIRVGSALFDGVEPSAAPSAAEGLA